MNKILTLELIWMLATVILAVLIMLPIYQNEQGFEFYVFNITSILIFVTFTRYIFQLHNSYLFQKKWPKAVWFVLCIPIFLFVLEGVFTFQIYMDDHGANIFYQHLNFERQKALGAYTRNQLIFFGVGALITSVIFPFRLLIAVWRDINKKN